MPTDNPKISLYVPQQIYDRFRDFQQEQNLSMSQAGTVVLAEYFGLEETIKEITKGTTIGGVTLAEFEIIKKRLSQLENEIKLRPVGGLRIGSQLELLSEPKSIKPITSKLLGVRFGMSKNVASNHKRKSSTEDFAAWSVKKDPDNIAWIPSSDGKGYIPRDNLPSELCSKLQKWIEENQ